MIKNIFYKPRGKASMNQALNYIHVDNNIKDMPKICQRYTDKPKIHRRYPKATSNICQRYAKDRPKICQRYAKDMLKICQRYGKDMPKIS